MFDEVQLDPQICELATGGPLTGTVVVTMASGKEQRVGVLSASRLRYELSSDVMTKSQIQSLLIFFRARKGKLRGWRFKDWTDYQATNEALTNPYPAAAMQLVKTYTSGGQSEVRTIKKPVAGSVTLQRDTGGGFADWASGGNWSLDTTTGIVTITTPTAGHSYRWSGEFDVPVRFDDDQLRFTSMAATYQNLTVAILELI